MDIPSLTRKKEFAEGTLKMSYIPESVFEDLGLKGMISENMSEFLSQPVSSENIVLRQNVIKEIFSDGGTSDGCFEKFEALSGILGEIASARENFNRSSSEAEKDVLFVTWALFADKYINESKAFDGKSEFVSEYYEYFASFVDSDEYRKFSKELSAIGTMLDRIRIHSIRIGRKGIVTQKGKENNDYISKLMKYAEDMKISGFAPPPSIKRNIPVSIIESFAELNPDVFGRMRKFREEYIEYIRGDTDRCRRECEFYIEVKKLSDKIRERGIPLCFPEVSDVPLYNASEIYDISLLKAGYEIIPNDAEFSEKDNFFFLTGANGGGKTTYIRTVGIALILFLGGCFVPCRKAKIYPFKKMFAHFPRDERFEGTGRLVDEKNRADEILNVSDNKSFVLFNETFSGTDEIKSAQMTEALGKTCYERGIFGVYVTHIHSMADLNIPMLNVVVDTDDNNRRTFKVLRRDSVRSSYAHDILKKYGLTAEQLALLKKTVKS